MKKGRDVLFGEHLLKGDFVGPAESASVAILHGAGQGTRDRFLSWRRKLAEVGITSLAFDFIGHGETGGQLVDSSLELRTQQALTAIRSAPCQTPLSVLGSSMGAYNAIRLTQEIEIQNLILCVPGVYTPEAYSVPFGPKFSEVIRVERSWEVTDAWEILSTFTGNLLIVAAEDDKVIPDEIPQRLYDSAGAAASRDLYIIPGSPHLFLHYLTEHPELFESFCARTLSTLRA